MENLTKFELNRRRRKRLALIAGLTLLFFTALLWGFQGLAWGLAAFKSSDQIPGFFTDSGQDVGGGAENVIALGDLDGDGDLDAFVRTHIWMNDGYGYFSDSGQNLNLPGDLREMALGDVDGDGDLDAIFASGSSEPNQVWLNDGSGSFTNSGQDLGGADSWALATGDVDGDDDLDVLFTDGGGHSLWLNDGTGVFTDSNQNLGNSGVRSVALQDLDGDQDLDAFFADCTIWLNDGTGAFTLKSQSLCPSDNVTLAMGDVDGDNDLDAFVGNATTQPNLVWLNDGAANFSDSGQLLGNSSSEQVALGDLDGDGDLDAFVGNTTEAGSDPGDKVWFNDGTGVFSDSGQSLGTYETFGVALGDVDGDGDLDALVGTRDTPNRLLWNGGTVPPMFYVDGTTGNDSGNCRDAAAPCATIGYAISQAVSGGTILVAQGTYTENLTITGIAVTLRGGYTISDTSWIAGTGETTVNGNDVDRVFYIHSGADVTLENLTITGGRAPEDQCWGGGVSVSSAAATIRNALITNNRADCTGEFGGAGGAVDANTDLGGPVNLTIEDSILGDNFAKQHGGAMNLFQATTFMTNVLVINNNQQVIGAFEGNLSIVNSTIAENSQEGNAILDFDSSAHISLLNTIVWHSGPLACGQGGGTCTATYSDIEGGWPGTGNINADPLFVGGGDYHLQVGSPCIDKGTAVGAPAHDIEGTSRDAAPDMGAYEWAGFRVFLPLTLKNFGP